MKTISLAVILSAALGVPAFAQGVSGSLNTQSSASASVAGTTATTSLGASASADVSGEVAADAARKGLDTAAAAQTAAAAKGAVVLSSDGMMLGLVRKARFDGEGMLRLDIDVDDAVSGAKRTITLMVPVEAYTEGEIDTGLTAADFSAQLG